MSMFTARDDLGPNRAVELSTENKEPGPEGPRLVNASRDLADSLPAATVALAVARTALAVHPATGVLRLADGAGRIVGAVGIGTVKIAVAVIVDSVGAPADLGVRRKTAV